MGTDRAYITWCTQECRKSAASIARLVLHDSEVLLLCTSCAARSMEGWDVPDSVVDAVCYTVQLNRELGDVGQEAINSVSQGNQDVRKLLWVLYKTGDVSSKLGKFLAAYQSLRDYYATSGSQRVSEGAHEVSGVDEPIHTTFELADDNEWTFYGRMDAGYTLQALEMDLLANGVVWPHWLRINETNVDPQVHMDAVVGDFANGQAEVAVYHRQR